MHDGMGEFPLVKSSVGHSLERAVALCNEIRYALIGFYSPFSLTREKIGVGDAFQQTSVVVGAAFGQSKYRQ